MRCTAVLLFLCLQQLYGDGFSYINGTATDLGSNFYPTGINDSGEILGDVLGATGNVTSSYLIQDGAMTQIGLPGASSSSGDLINSSGEILGASTINGTLHYFLFDGIGYTDLSGLVPAGQTVIGLGLNNLGQVMLETANSPFGTVGSVYIIDHGVSHLQGTIAVPGSVGLPTISGYSDAGVSVGWVGTTPPYGDPPYISYLYQNGRLTLFNSIDPAFSNYPSAYPTRINAAGDIIGTTSVAGTQPGGFVYQNGSFTFLLFPPSAISSTGNFLAYGGGNYFWTSNLNGVTTSNVDLATALYGPNNGLYHEMSLSVDAVNDSGDVVGYIDSDTVVPEPKSLELCLFGLALAVGIPALRAK